jgi:ech hydrogenase subunit D
MSIGMAQTFETIPCGELLEKVSGLRKAGYRLVQISATRLPACGAEAATPPASAGTPPARHRPEHVELTYSFDRDHQLANLRLQIPAAESRIPSISSIFWCAFLYENELHDLFNLQVDGMAVDFHGHLYETAVKFPFGSTKPPVVKPAPAPAAGQPASKSTAPQSEPLNVASRP